MAEMYVRLSNDSKLEQFADLIFASDLRGYSDTIRRLHRFSLFVPLFVTPMLANIQAHSVISKL